MAINVTQMSTDARAVETALDTLKAHFGSDSIYYASQLLAIERAREAVRQIADETRSGINTK